VRTFIVLIALLVAAGCASVEEGTKVVYRTKEVKVPVEVPCKVTTPPPPISWAMEEAKVTDSIFTKVAAALAEIEQHIAFEEELVAALKACQ